MEPEGIQLAPNIYTLVVPPAAMEHWQEPHLQETLIGIIRTSAQDAGLRFEFPPVIMINVNASLSPETINVLASHQVRSPMEDTQNTSANPEENSVEDDTMPENAFLIIEGVKVFPLKSPVVNIGRRLDNTLVIDDPRVSRNHAQLRCNQRTVCNLRSKFNRRNIHQWTAHQPKRALPGRCRIASRSGADLWSG